MSHRQGENIIKANVLSLKLCFCSSVYFKDCFMKVLDSWVYLVSRQSTEEVFKDTLKKKKKSCKQYYIDKSNVQSLAFHIFCLRCCLHLYFLGVSDGLYLPPYQWWLSPQSSWNPTFLQWINCVLPLHILIWPPGNTYSSNTHVYSLIPDTVILLNAEITLLK